MKVAIIEYSTYGHIAELARAIKQGVEELGVASQVDIYQVPETLSPEVLALLHAPEKPKDIPVATIDTLTQYDAFLFGIPTRFGTLPAQWTEFWGQTGGLWTQGALYGKPAGIFVSTGTPGGGQEMTVRNSISYLAHHGLPYIPLGYAKAFAEITSLDEPHGGSPWGAGTFAGADGSRQPLPVELKIARIQGKSFAEQALKLLGGGKSAGAANAGHLATGQQKDATSAANAGQLTTGQLDELAAGQLATGQLATGQLKDATGATAGHLATGAAVGAGAAGAAAVAGGAAAAAASSKHGKEVESHAKDVESHAKGVEAHAKGAESHAKDVEGNAKDHGKDVAANVKTNGEAAGKTLAADGQAVANDSKVTEKVEEKANADALKKREKQAEKKGKEEEKSKCSKCIIM